ncbi:MAG: hypothetical protein ACYC5Q_01340 [Thermoleophilia bacterium]
MKTRAGGLLIQEIAALEEARPAEHGDARYHLFGGRGLAIRQTASAVNAPLNRKHVRPSSERSLGHCGGSSNED